MNSKQTIFYKYRKFNHESLSIFINKELYFAQPTTFNDPFDSQIDITSAMDEALARIDKKINPESHLFLKKDINAVYVKKVQERAAKIGVFCLSKQNREILLWSHYADEHKGICIGFELEDKFKKPGQHRGLLGTWPVNYIRENPYVPIFMRLANSRKTINDEHLNFVITAFTHKTSNWRYEKENRVIRTDPGIESFNPPMVKEIIFGLKTEPRNKRTLKALLSGVQWKHVKFRQVYRSGSELQLKIRRANTHDYLDK